MKPPSNTISVFSPDGELSFITILLLKKPNIILNVNTKSEESNIKDKIRIFNILNFLGFIMIYTIQYIIDAIKQIIRIRSRDVYNKCMPRTFVVMKYKTK